MNASTSVDFMNLALQLAERGRLSVSPNPMVGCVIVKANQIIGQGYHQRAGEAHAEVLALQEAGDHAQGADVYLSLEPCCHQGRTPPCTQALIAARVKKVYVACQDPNPQVAGQGIAALRAAGIEVEQGICEQAALRLNEVFFHYITQRRPFVIAKWAMSLNGRTTVNAGDSKQLSCPESQQLTHQLRQQVDGILVGAHTVLQDDPQLTARLIEAKDKQPTRIILSGRQQLPLSLHIFDQQLPGKTIIVSSNQDDKLWFKSILSEKIELIIVRKDNNGQIHLPTLLDELGNKQITSLLVEGGMKVHESFFRAHLVNKIQVQLTPFFIGSQGNKQPVQFCDSFIVGNDFHVLASP